MKKIYTAIITLAFSLVSTATLAGNNTDNNNVATTNSATYYINAPRFVRPLIEKWITEYQKVNPQAKFAIAKTPANKTNSALNIQLSESSGSKDLAKKTVYFAEYAILPITGKNSEAAKALGHQELNSKKIKSLFFENEDIENQDKKDKNSNWVVYTGNSTQSVANEFASHYGKDASSFRGKRIIGDDQFLNTAILKDPQGISFNAISNIYDLQTRRLKTDLSLLPLDVDKSKRPAFAEGATLDDLINVLEASKGDDIPVERVGFTFQDNDLVVSDFIAWVVNHGENYNHEYGLLNISHK